MIGVFKKQWVYWINFYVNAHRKRRRIGADKRLPDTVPCKLNYDHCNALAIPLITAIS
jgi:hypothetical protein